MNEYDLITLSMMTIMATVFKLSGIVSTMHKRGPPELGINFPSYQGAVATPRKDAPDSELI